MQASSPDLSWPQRWWLYLHEMFQPGSRLIFALLSALSLGWAELALQGRALSLDGRLGLATASIWLILLYYRLCDEFKDLDTDRRHFPERPVPSGRVRLSDLRAMQLAASGGGFVLNLLWPLAPAAFGLLYLYAWLMGKWFFLPTLIGNNRLLAFVTHSPISFFGSAYVLALYRPDWGMTEALLLLWSGLPGFAWEIARKTRAPAHEEAGYQIYSTMLGYRGAALLPPLFALGQWGCGLLLARSLALPGWFLPLLSLITLAYCLPFALFLQAPERWESRLKPASEAYTAGMLVLLPLALGLSRTLTWSL